MTIHTVTGQKLATVLSDRQQAGHYQVVWDGRDSAGREVASGLYLYRLAVGSFTETRRMVLLR